MLQNFLFPCNTSSFGAFSLSLYYYTAKNCYVVNAVMACTYTCLHKHGEDTHRSEKAHLRSELGVVNQVLQWVATAKFVQKPRQIADNRWWVWCVNVA